eukprot:GILI01027762.1.p1 GENE.GILI01027762.1~~GILI01027762.1.p1  ORF type:complete len:127 (+),score=1.70 GILI01027762.1:41-421(+)
MPTQGFYPTVGCMLGLAGVGLGAFGAHGLRARGVSAELIQSWGTAVQYQLLHAILIVGVGLYRKTLIKASPAPYKNALRCWVAGTALYSGGIYVLALGGPRLPATWGTCDPPWLGSCGFRSVNSEY